VLLEGARWDYEGLRARQSLKFTVFAQNFSVLAENVSVLAENVLVFAENVSESRG
jgi:hypothetical protein